MHIYTLYKNSVPINLQVAFLHQSSGKTKIAAMKHGRNELHAKSQIWHDKQTHGWRRHIYVIYKTKYKENAA